MPACTRATLLAALISAPFLGHTAAAVGATTSKPVTVTNTVATTADAGPFSVALNLTLANGTASQTFTVPAGYRLVIDYMSARTVLYTVGSAASLSIGTISNGATWQGFPPMELVGTIDGSTFYALGSMTKIYADAGSTVTVALLSASQTGGATIGITGHLVAMPG